jgi:hypothetical protein
MAGRAASILGLIKLTNHRPKYSFNLVTGCLFRWLHKPLEMADRTTFLVYN